MLCIKEAPLLKSSTLKAWLQNKPYLSKKVLFICNVFFFFPFFWWGWGEKMTVACRTNHSYLKELFPFICIIQESRILSYQLLFLFLFLFRVQEKGFCIGNLSQYVAIVMLQSYFFLFVMFDRLVVQDVILSALFLFLFRVQDVKVSSLFELVCFYTCLRVYIAHKQEIQN